MADGDGFPVGLSAMEVVTSPRGFARRSREATAILNSSPVEFAVERVGGRWETEDEAFRQFPFVHNKPTWCEAIPLAANSDGSIPAGRFLPSVEPIFRDGRRWPVVEAFETRTVYQLCVRYWRPATEIRAATPAIKRPSKKQLRKMTAAELKAFVNAPLGVDRAQKGLDVGLFEVRDPIFPGELIADE